MDRLTHKSITNCIKELDALRNLILSENFDHPLIAEWVSEISWNLANVFRRVRYDSDEFQHRLAQLVQETKRVKQRKEKREQKDFSKDWREDV